MFYIWVIIFLPKGSVWIFARYWWSSFETMLLADTVVFTFSSSASCPSNHGLHIFSIKLCLWWVAPCGYSKRILYNYIYTTTVILRGVGVFTVFFFYCKFLRLLPGFFLVPYCIGSSCLPLRPWYGLLYSSYQRFSVQPMQMSPPFKLPFFDEMLCSNIAQFCHYIFCFNGHTFHSS